MARYKKTKSPVIIHDADVRVMANQAAKREDMPVTSLCSRLLRKALRSTLGIDDEQLQAKSA